MANATREATSKPASNAPIQAAVAAPERGFPGEKRIEKTAAELLAYNDDHTQAQMEGMIRPYLGKPIEVQGFLSNVNRGANGWLHVLLTLQGRGRLISARCAPEWYEAFIDLQKREKVTLVGRLTRVGISTVELADAELVDQS